jgi:prepilin-type N-terminal cleavage/methylation domain-containing protein
MKSSSTKFIMDSGRGFSLLEFIIVIVVLGIIAATGAQLMGNGFSAYFTGKNITEMDWQARLAVERMTRELRSVRAPADLTVTPANEITFIDADGNSIRYCMGTVGTCPGAAGELTRNTQPLATGISNLAFIYLDRTSVATTTPALVYYIVVSFTATQGGLSKAYQININPRNFP